MTELSVIKSPASVNLAKQPRVPRRQRLTKKATLISLLSKGKGVDVGSLGKKLGWQTHSIRAAMTGLRKSGYVIELTKPDKGKPSKYRITGAPEEKGG